ncbi:HNH endonuclease [Gordonia sp. PP30]|uniref:HNH endonuclease signature motif containing protein n=1 Tax=unclassified Gordonia (in: high G+C Gram-positive bacteria) TaxID=2657482 RepID=UPI001FFE848B|nr:HNH endonuclease signature motif containing protein [Gordonia sp. PP30]UQE75970.1 HNH endonuclease [Gordonia sp. PP30]
MSATDLFDRTAPADLDDEQLAERVIGYATQIAALTARMLDYLAEFDERKAWAGEGIASCAHWLVWQAGFSLRTAQEHVRAARALHDLPKIHDAFAAGQLSYAKVRAMTRVATPDREEELLNVARAATAAQVETLCRAIRDNDARINDSSGDNDAEPPLPESWGRWKWNYDGTLTVNMRLNAVDGAHFLAAIVRAEYDRTRTPDDPDLPAEPPSSAELVEAPSVEFIETQPGPIDTRRDLWRNVPGNIAPEVTAIADTIIAGIDMPEVAAGAEILVHRVNAEASLDDGPALRSAEREEMECAATVREIGHEPGNSVTVGGRRMGPVLWWGRKRRVPNAALVRTILMRDRTCQAPGCTRTRHLHIHHVTMWSAGGTTDPDNLILLCSSHHRALHHGAFSIEALGHQRFAFRGTHGEILDLAPLHTPAGDWHPDLHVEPDGVTTIGGGRINYGYATEVLYAAWAWRERQKHDEDPTYAKAA